MVFDLCRFLSWFRQVHFFTGRKWIMDSYFSQKRPFEIKILIKNVWMMDFFLTNMQLLASQDVNWWTGVVWITCGLLWCFYQLFELSFWRHPFTAEDLLVSKQWNATLLYKNCKLHTMTWYLHNFNLPYFVYLLAYLMDIVIFLALLAL